MAEPQENNVYRGWQRNPILTTLGMAVIDEIRVGNETVAVDALGGSGAYCTVGARIMLAFPNYPTSISWKVLAGEDFPDKIERDLKKWHVNLILEKSADRTSTRGLLEYEASLSGAKRFRYTTPELQVEPEDLEGTNMLESASFHVLCHPNKIDNLVRTLLSLPRGTQVRPLIIWEPSPLACTVDNLQLCLQGVKAVDVFSPNHIELLALCDQQNTNEFDRTDIEQCADRFLNAGIGPTGQGIALIRAGEYGCMLKINTETSALWLPPFYSKHQQHNVVDPTGAGNAFLGGFAVGYYDTKDFEQAACYGQVAASFVLEQVGLPQVTARNGTVYWNGDKPRKRLLEYKASLEWRRDT